MKKIVLVGLSVFVFFGCSENVDSGEATQPGTWYKGNLHTHSLWSDGDDYPEMIISWYKENGYDFLALSDHNTLAEGAVWKAAHYVRGGATALEKYRQLFGDEWVETKTERDTLWVRLKTYDEYKAKLEEAGKFLLIQSEEISDGFERKPIHINVTNIADAIEPQGGTSVRDVMQRNIAAVMAQREKLGTPMFPHINHPNFGWAITAEDLMALEGEQFFEVYNGHPMVRNHGEGDRPGMERMWDIILARRLLQGNPIMYGIGVDDSHNYHETGIEHSNTGRAWVMVRAQNLSPNAIVEAMEAGDFYSTTGVLLSDLQVEDDQLAFEINAEPGVTYETTFIGTKMNHDSTSVPVEVEGAAVTRRYSDEVGIELMRVSGIKPSYTFNGDELYVRAKVTSSKPKENPYQENETEMAWIQPVKSRSKN